MSTTKSQELMCLTKLEEDILMFGKIERQESSKPFECDRDSKRLKEYRFFELQEKYCYGWYIAEDDLETQVKNIGRFKEFIIDNYKP